MVKIIHASDLPGFDIAEHLDNTQIKWSPPSRQFFTESKLLL